MQLEIGSYIDSEATVTLQSGITVTGKIAWKYSDQRNFILVTEHNHPDTRVFEHLILVDQIAMITKERST